MRTEPGWGVLTAPGLAVIDREELLRACSVLFDPAHSVELRGLPSGQSFVRPGDRPDELIECASRLASDRGVYWCLNPVSIPPGADRAARVGDVVKRRWLLIDIDPVRPADSSATGEEKSAAQTLMAAVLDWLTARGWPAPVVVDSGNGWHLLYRIDLPNDAAGVSHSLLRRFLKALAGRFDTAAAGVDQKVHNASRISKLPGTWARKGAHTTERPHRKASIWHLPEPVELVEPDRIAEAIDELGQAGKDTVIENGPPPEAPAPAAGPQGWGTLPVPPSDRLTAYAKAALQGEAGEVLSAPEGGRNNQLNESTHSLATLVGAGLLSEAEVAEAMASAGRAVGLEEKEIERTIRSAMEAGKKKPRQVPPDRNGKADGQTDGTSQQPPGGWLVSLDDVTLAEGNPAEILGKIDLRLSTGGTRHFEMRTIGSLVKKEFPPIRWVVPGIMSEGLNLLAGAPKQGKSILALNLALTVAGGGLALGGFQTEQQEVLYLSLEDRQRRVKGRALKMIQTLPESVRAAVADRLTIATDWPRLDEGGLKLVELWCRKARHAGLVIVDVWNRFAPKARPSNRSAYQDDSDALHLVKSFVDDRGMAACVVHHTRKPSGGVSDSDYVAEVSGTMGLTGTADGILVLLRSRQEHEARLHVTGRDVSEQELVLSFAKDTLTWTSLGTADQHVAGRVQTAVLAHLKAVKIAFAKDIAAAVEQKEDSVRRALNRLFKDHLVRKSGNAWQWPGEVLDDDTLSA